MGSVLLTGLSNQQLFKMISKVFALLCLTQVALGTSEPQRYNGFARQQWGSRPFYSGDVKQLSIKLVPKVLQLEPSRLTLQVNWSRMFSLNKALLFVMEPFKPSGVPMLFQTLKMLLLWKGCSKVSET